IVGGGPAGATAARFLAEYGREVILLEKNFFFVKPCGGGIPLSAFDEFDIPPTLIKKEVKSIRLISPLSEKLDIELKGGSLSITERGEFDRTLRNMAEKHGAHVIEGEFRGITLHNNIYKIEATVGGERIEIVSEYVIAADGVNSGVRRALGINQSLSFFTVSEKIKEVETDCCEFWFGFTHAPGLYSWVFPSSEGVSAGTGCFETGKINDLFKRFAERRQIKSEGLKRIYKIPVWKGDLYNKGKIIFVGDAAGQVLPLNYEGIYYAMKAGELAARAIIEGKVNEYKRMWKASFQKRFFLMDKLKNYFLKNDSFTEKLVELHRRLEVQEASIKLWLRKDSSRDSLRSYVKLFRKFLI
ncbi:MAG: NAD(P)/FAD-dependent oxidoreductase, partial [Nitrospirota bacterium]|nr:NAD(P)/FAD-dependent oxidoreductase [Nitrospirota bacterium]